MSVLAQTAGTTTTLISSQLSQDEPSPFSTGGIMFFVVLAIILVGALVLYLRYRGTGSQARP